MCTWTLFISLNYLKQTNSCFKKWCHAPCHIYNEDGHSDLVRGSYWDNSIFFGLEMAWRWAHDCYIKELTEKVEWRKGWHSFEVSKVYKGIGTSFVFGTLALCFQLFKVSSTNSCTWQTHTNSFKSIFSN